MFSPSLRLHLGQLTLARAALDSQLCQHSHTANPSDSHMDHSGRYVMQGGAAWTGRWVLWRHVSLSTNFYRGNSINISHPTDCHRPRSQFCWGDVGSEKTEGTSAMLLDKQDKSSNGTITVTSFTVCQPLVDFGKCSLHLGWIWSKNSVIQVF